MNDWNEIMRLLQWAFKLYDKDGGGAIDIGEMVEAVGTLHAMSAVELVGRMDSLVMLN